MQKVVVVTVASVACFCAMGAATGAEPEAPESRNPGRRIYQKVRTAKLLKEKNMDPVDKILDEIENETKDDPELHDFYAKLLYCENQVPRLCNVDFIGLGKLPANVKRRVKYKTFEYAKLTRIEAIFRRKMQEEFEKLPDEKQKQVKEKFDQFVEALFAANKKDIAELKAENEKYLQLLQNFVIEGKQLPEGEYVLSVLNNYLGSLSYNQLMNLKEPTNDEKEQQEKIIQLCEQVMTKIYDDLKKLIENDIDFESQIKELLNLLANPFLPKDLQFKFHNIFTNFVINSIKDGRAYPYYSLVKSWLIPAAYSYNDIIPKDFFQKIKRNTYYRMREYFLSDLDLSDPNKEDFFANSGKYEVYETDPEVVKKVDEFHQFIMDKNAPILDTIDFGIIGGLFIKLRTVKLRMIASSFLTRDILPDAKLLFLDIILFLSWPLVLLDNVIAQIVV